MDRKPDPTPEEIELMCQIIQAGWTEEERKRREARCGLGSGGMLSKHVEIQIVRVQPVQRRSKNRRLL